MRKLNTTTTVHEFMRNHNSLIDSLRHYGQILGNTRNYSYMAPTLSNLAEELKDFDPAYCAGFASPFEPKDDGRFFILEYKEKEGITHFNYLENGAFHNALGTNGYAPVSVLPDSFQEDDEFMNLIGDLADKKASLGDFTAAVYMWILKNK